MIRWVVGMRNSNGDEYLIVIGLKWKRFVQRKIKWWVRTHHGTKSHWGWLAQLPPIFLKLIWSGGGIGRHEGLKIPCH